MKSLTALITATVIGTTVLATPSARAGLVFDVHDQKDPIGSKYVVDLITCLAQYAHGYGTFKGSDGKNSYHLSHPYVPAPPFQLMFATKNQYHLRHPQYPEDPVLVFNDADKNHTVTPGDSLYILDTSSPGKESLYLFGANGHITFQQSNKERVLTQFNRILKDASLAPEEESRLHDRASRSQEEAHRTLFTVLETISTHYTYSRTGVCSNLPTEWK